MRYSSARFLLSVVALATLPLLTACQRGEAAPTGDVPDPAPLVEAVMARAGSLPLEERLNGVVRAKNQVTVRPEITAPVVEVLVESGEAVTRGQALVRLDDATAAQQMRQAEASQRLAAAEARAARARVEELRAMVSRNRQLAAQELISDLDLETQEAQLLAAEAEAEQAVAQVDAAQAVVEERRADLARTVVRSPVDGRVGQRRAEVGLLVDPGTLLYRVGNLDRVIVEVPLTEAMLNYLQPGQTALIRPPSSDAAPLRAALTRISPFLEDGSFSTVAEIELDNSEGRLRPGMFVTVDILYGESEQATLVPSNALWDDPRTGVLGIYVLTDMPADAGAVDTETVDTEAVDTEETEPYAVALRPVDVLAEGRASLGIRGVEPGDWVVTLGQHLLGSDGDATARVRPTTWERVFELQGMQREDLLEGFLEKQQRLAKTMGAAVPSSEEYLGGSTDEGSSDSTADGAEGRR